ncbi:hypothetical protein BDR06DRAFT_459249 [Suillus hirtellus]|nr:hypothetical protein BDR06DRAFT_459249 [Suillus hirtellus]
MNYNKRCLYTQFAVVFFSSSLPILFEWHADSVLSTMRFRAVRISAEVGNSFSQSTSFQRSRAETAKSETETRSKLI